MSKKFRCRKGLSPVVAAIILIAVTVAVSIAVAAWMGALTIGFMATEQISFTHVAFAPNLSHANITIKNTGTGALTISDVLVNGKTKESGTGWSVTASTTDLLDPSMDPNEEITITVYAADYPTSAGIVNGFFDSGANYGFTIVTEKNNQFGPYTVAAQPS